MRKWFIGVKTVEELRKRYRELLKMYHPDNEKGSVEITQEINAEYDLVFSILSRERMDELLLKKQSLKGKQKDQQDINKRLSEFQKVISKHEVLKKFDRHVFESIIDRVIVGEKAENGVINPYKLKFIFKTGYERDEVASEQPFSFGNSCSNTSYDCGIISPQGDNDTCGDGSSFVPTKTR